MNNIYIYIYIYIYYKKKKEKNVPGMSNLQGGQKTFLFQNQKIQLFFLKKPLMILLPPKKFIYKKIVFFFWIFLERGKGRKKIKEEKRKK